MKRATFVCAAVMAAAVVAYAGEPQQQGSTSATGAPTAPVPPGVATVDKPHVSPATANREAAAAEARRPAAVVWQAPPNVKVEAQKASSIPAPDEKVSSDLPEGMKTVSVPRSSSDGDVTKMSTELRDLKWAVGRWSFFQSRENAAENEQEDSGTVVAKVGPGGHSIIFDTTVTAGPNAGTSTHEVLVWSPAQRVYEIYTFDSTSAAPSVAPASFDGHTLSFRRIQENGGKRVSAQVTFDRITAKGYSRTTEIVTSGSKSATVLRMQLRKQS